MKRKILVLTVFLSFCLFSSMALANPPTYSSVSDDSGGSVLEGTIVNVSVFWEDATSYLDTGLFYHNASGNMNLTNESIFSAQQFNMLGNYEAGGSFRTSVAVSNGYVYAGSYSDQNIWQFNSSTMEPLNNYTAGGLVYASPTVSNGYVYIGTNDDKLYKFNATSLNLVNSFDAGDNIYMSPVVNNGYVYVGNYIGDFYKIDVDTMEQVDNYTALGSSYFSPAFANGYIYIGSYDDKIHQIDTTDMSLVSSYDTGSNVEVAPTVTDKYVYVGSTNGNVYQLNATNVSDVVNTYSTGGQIIGSSVAVTEKYIYFGNYESKVYKLNATNLNYVNDYTTGDLVTSSPIVVGNYVYFGSDDDKVYQLNSTDMSLVNSYSTGSDIEASPAVADGYLYVGSNDNNLYKFGIGYTPNSKWKTFGRFYNRTAFLEQNKNQFSESWYNTTIDTTGDGGKTIAWYQTANNTAGNENTSMSTDLNTFYVNLAPTVNILDVPSSVPLTESELNNTFQVTCQYTDENGYGDIDEPVSYIGTQDFNIGLDASGVTITEVNSTTANATATMQQIPYYRSPGAYDVECYVVDSAGASDSLIGTTDIATLLASDVNVSSLDFGSIFPSNSATTSTFKVENTGNVQLNSSWKGTDFTGPDTIAISNANITSGTYGDLTLSTSAQLYASFLPTQTDVGEPNRYYEPNFELYVPIGTPAGTYQNTFTHSAVEA